jgi:hypothetical protein
MSQSYNVTIEGKIFKAEGKDEIQAFIDVMKTKEVKDFAYKILIQSGNLKAVIKH